MIEEPWDDAFFADCAANYTMNKFPDATEVREIAKQWNIDDFDFYMNLRKWFSGRRMAEQEIVQRRDKARKAAA